MDKVTFPHSRRIQYTFFEWIVDLFSNTFFFDLYHFSLFFIFYTCLIFLQNEQIYKCNLT
jgi:hypothetical protein